jgi:hypothetical protein
VGNLDSFQLYRAIVRRNCLQGVQVLRKSGESIWRGEILLYSAARRGATWARIGDELAFELTPLVFMLAPNA